MKVGRKQSYENLALYPLLSTHIGKHPLSKDVRAQKQWESS
jgi:hypothetical protein